MTYKKKRQKKKSIPTKLLDIYKNWKPKKRIKSAQLLHSEIIIIAIIQLLKQKLK